MFIEDVRRSVKTLAVCMENGPGSETVKIQCHSFLLLGYCFFFCFCFCFLLLFFFFFFFFFVLFCFVLFFFLVDVTVFYG